MATENDDLLRAHVCEARVTLGDWQGVAEVPGTYFERAGASLDPNQVAPVLIAALRDLIPAATWARVGHSTRGEAMDVALRTPCAMVSAFSWASTFAPPDDASTLRAAAAAGARWLISVQGADGQFPFPDLTDDGEVWLTDCARTGASAAQCRGQMPRLFELALGGKAEWEAMGRRTASWSTDGF